MNEWILQNQHLEVRVDSATLEAQVFQRESGLSWRFQRHAEELRVVHGARSSYARLSDARQITPRRYTSTTEDRLTCFIEGLPGNTALAVTFALPADEPILRIEVDPFPSTTPATIAEVWYPGEVALENDTPDYTVWPNMAGTLVPATYDRAIGIDDDEAEKGPKHHYHEALARTLYQPWWGVVGQQGAYLAIAETPFDFALDLWHPAGGPTHTSPAWLPSMGRSAYPRAIRYQFFKGANYVTLAKAYRAYSQAIGRWLSLEAKFARNPIAERLVGSMIFSPSVCSYDHQQRPPRLHVTPFAELTKRLERLPSLGVERAYLHVDGWGFHGYDNHHPDVLPPCQEAGGWEGLIAFSQAAHERGYLFGLHDQYRDYYLDGPAFQESRAVKRADGSLPYHDVWAGGPQTVLCAKEALPYVRRTFTEMLARGVRLTGSYLDVFAVVNMDECYDPAHPMTREDCFRHRAAALDYVRELGIAISSEEPVDHFVPHLDFAHWADFPRWEFMKGDYLGVPVPLHNLVYHDALLLPAVYDYSYDRSLRRNYFLEGLAQVEIPYASLHLEQATQFEYAKQMAALHSAWGTHELVGHELLEADGSVQAFDYPEGRIEIDKGRGAYRIQGGPLATDDWQTAAID